MGSSYTAVEPFIPFIPTSSTGPNPKSNHGTRVVVATSLSASYFAQTRPKKVCLNMWVEVCKADIGIGAYGSTGYSGLNALLM